MAAMRISAALSLSLLLRETGVGAAATPLRAEQPEQGVLQEVERSTAVHELDETSAVAVAPAKGAETHMYLIKPSECYWVKGFPSRSSPEDKIENPSPYHLYSIMDVDQTCMMLGSKLGDYDDDGPRVPPRLEGDWASLASVLNVDINIVTGDDPKSRRLTWDIVPTKIKRPPNPERPTINILGACTSREAAQDLNAKRKPGGPVWIGFNYYFHIMLGHLLYCQKPSEIPSEIPDGYQDKEKVKGCCGLTGRGEPHINRLKAKACWAYELVHHRKCVMLTPDTVKTKLEKIKTRQEEEKKQQQLQIGKMQVFSSKDGVTLPESVPSSFKESVEKMYYDIYKRFNADEGCGESPADVLKFATGSAEAARRTEGRP